MSVLDEIKWFCQEKNPVGALLVSGKWGCGKTFLINYILPNCIEIKTSYELIRVSLFGELSAQEIHKKVKYEYAKKKYLQGIDQKSKALKTAQNIGSGIKSIISKIPKIGEAADALFSVDWLDFINVDEKINEKKVLLIFDDFERCELSTTSLLGCLNEYVENLGMKVLIVADEEKISSKIEKSLADDGCKVGENSNGIEQKNKYSILKEKLICRTVKHIPDYAEIVAQIVENYSSTNHKYKAFIQRNIFIIQRVFLDSKSDNIRSLKCAIQDFERIFLCLDKHGFADQQLEMYLGTFLALEFEYKGGNLKSYKYGYINKFSEKYYYYNNLYVINSCRDWLTEGEWNQKAIENEIMLDFERMKSLEPDAMVLIYNITDLDDTVFEKGYPIVLEKAYSSLLSIDEYISLISIQMQARIVNIEIPSIDYQRLKAALITRIRNLCSGLITEPRGHSFIDEDNMRLLLTSEKEIYNIIDDYRNFEQHYKNKIIYIDFLKKLNPSFEEVFQKYYKAFDIEMAEVTSMYYFNTLKKYDFCSAFFKCWRSSVNTLLPEDKKESVEAFKNLRASISANISTKKIQGAIDRLFVKNLDDLIDKYSTSLSDK